MRATCGNCDNKFSINKFDIIWDYSGYGYDTGYVICPECGQINIVKYFEYDIDINNDARYYIYD